MLSSALRAAIEASGVFDNSSIASLMPVAEVRVFSGEPPDNPDDAELSAPLLVFPCSVSANTDAQNDGVCLSNIVRTGGATAVLNDGWLGHARIVVGSDIGEYNDTSALRIVCALHMDDRFKDVLLGEKYSLYQNSSESFSLGVTRTETSGGGDGGGDGEGYGESYGASYGTSTIYL